HAYQRKHQCEYHTLHQRGWHSKSTDVLYTTTEYYAIPFNLISVFYVPILITRKTLVLD
ncbi:hypothetical protein BGX38DRAFT_1163185, partial [Terfezia claveryi]